MDSEYYLYIRVALTAMPEAAHSYMLSGNCYCFAFMASDGITATYQLKVQFPTEADAVI